LIKQQNKRGGSLLKFANKVAVVTGGTRGIGYQIVRKLADEGASVIALSKGGRFEDDVDLANETGLSNHNSISVMKVDVASKKEVDEVFQQIYQKYGRIDILVNSAGINEGGKVNELTESQWDRMMAVNVKGVLFCSQAVYNIMARQKYGKIINLSSITGKRAGVYAGVHYSVSKAAVIMLTRCLAKELAEYQVNVNAIAPAFTDTPMNSYFTPAQVQETAKNIPLGRIAEPEEMANVVAFLASDEAGYITGEVINVNGGSLMD
jgi:3-oxoacyl-[acyl-carrier protein] reductase